MNAESDIPNMRFRDAMSRLDTIVNKLESNTLELEDSIELYKEGVALLGHLRSKLDTAQQEVDMLMGKLDVQGDDTTTDTTLS